MNDIAFSVIIKNDGISDIIFKTIMLKGEDGNSISSIEKTSTSGLVDTYTIYLTDGTIGGTFTVTNGTGSTFDDELDSTSENAVQNKVVKSAIDSLDTSKININGLAEVTPQNLQIVGTTFSPNLIDETKITNEKYISKNGTINDNSGYQVTDYIPVEAGEDYCFTWKYSGNRDDARLRFMACYNANKEIIASAGSDTMISTYPITMAQSVAFVRLSFSNNTSYSQFQFEKGEMPTEYHEYGEIINTIIKDEYIPDTSLDKIEAFGLVDGQNLLNQNDADFVAGGFLNVSGSISENLSYATSGYIAVSEGEKLIGAYYRNGAQGDVMFRTVACYDTNKTAITAKGKYSVNEFVVPSGVAFVRICYSSGAYGGQVQICKSDSNVCKPYKEYEPPHYEIKDDYVPSGKAPLHVYLPKDLYVAVGRTIELYNEQIVIDHEKYHFRWVCGKGYATKRKFSITGTTAGDNQLVLYIYDDEMNVCWIGKCVIHVVNASNPVKKILPIGDSLTNWKAWLQETMLLSNNNITFVGTRYSGQSTDSEGNIYPSGTIHSEGRSGFSAGDYLANSSYTFDNRYDGDEGVSGTANPFWDGSKFSLQYYLNTQPQINMPDAVQIFLGTNDLGDGVETAIANISSMVNAIRTEFANLPIFLCHTIFRSNQNGYGSVGDDAYTGGSGANAWQYEQDIKVQNLMRGLYDELKSDSLVYFIPLATCMDREYNFGQVMTKVNPRSDVEIPMPNESVHPQASGYYQMADLMYSFYCGILS